MGASGGSFCIFAIGEMLEMYCNYSATKLQDIVYALLRLSAETADKARLKPNYHCQWHEVFKQAADHCACISKFILCQDVAKDTYRCGQRKGGGL